MLCHLAIGRDAILFLAPTPRGLGCRGSAGKPRNCIATDHGPPSGQAGSWHPEYILVALRLCLDQRTVDCVPTLFVRREKSTVTG